MRYILVYEQYEEDNWEHSYCEHTFLAIFPAGTSDFEINCAINSKWQELDAYFYTTQTTRYFERQDKNENN